MASPDRFARLEHVLGGKKLLQKLAAIFDTPWTKAGKG